MADEKQENWLKSAPDEELERMYAAGPSRDKERLIKFELDRRKQRKQDKISRRSMYAGIAGAVAAIASAFVATTQLVTPTSQELADAETRRRI